MNRSSHQVIYSIIHDVISIDAMPDNTMSMNNEKELRKLFPHADTILTLKFLKLFEVIE